jgi:hypothetical protein
MGSPQIVTVGAVRQRCTRLSALRTDAQRLALFVSASTVRIA